MKSERCVERWTVVCCEIDGEFVAVGVGVRAGGEGPSIVQISRLSRRGEGMSYVMVSRWELGKLELPSGFWENDPALPRHGLANDDLRRRPPPGNADVSAAPGEISTLEAQNSKL